MQDFEFTIEDEVLYMLQTRNGKRTGVAAVRIAAEMVKERLIDWKTAINRFLPNNLTKFFLPYSMRLPEESGFALQGLAGRTRCRQWTIFLMPKKPWKRPRRDRFCLPEVETSPKTCVE